MKAHRICQRYISRTWIALHIDVLKRAMKIVGALDRFSHPVGKVEVLYGFYIAGSCGGGDGIHGHHQCNLDTGLRELVRHADSCAASQGMANNNNGAYTSGFAIFDRFIGLNTGSRMVRNDRLDPSLAKLIGKLIHSQ
jgi:hypothetical protein